MSTLRTEAWVLESSLTKKEGELEKKEITLPKLTPHQAYVKPYYGCWEANQEHAISRDPVDICIQRGEPSVVLGNACVVKVHQVGSEVTKVKEGDICMTFGTIESDEDGYPIKVIGYDAPNRTGTMAKITILDDHHLIPFKGEVPFSLPQWAAFSARFVSAWSNWRVALACWRAQMPYAKPKDHYVCSWGGGVGLAEMMLAKDEGFQTIMIASKKDRLAEIQSKGIQTIDRNDFPNLNFNPYAFKKDPNLKERYKASEKQFLNRLHEMTNGKKVSIFVDNIGAPVFRATLKSLRRQGVIASCGWKRGMSISTMRAIECINRNTHVHTHYATYDEVVDAVQYAIKNNWMPTVEEAAIYKWDDIPALAEDYRSGSISSYFPVFEVNGE